MNERNDNPGWIFPFLIFCLFIYLLLCLVGCSTPRMANDSQRDSIRTVIQERIIYKDSLIYVPVPAESDNSILQDSDTSRLSTSMAESEAYVSGGRLHHSLRNKPGAVMPIHLKLANRVQSTEHYHLADRTVVVKVPREQTRWEKFIHMLGLGTFVVLCLAIIYIILRITRNFI